MKFTTTAVCLLVGSAFAAPTDMAADMSADVSAALSNMRLADLFSERQMTVFKLLSEHRHELGLDEKEVEVMDSFMEALHDDAPLITKRQVPFPGIVPTTGAIPNLTAIAANATGALNATALGSLGSLLGALGPLIANATGAAPGTASGSLVNATTGALTGGNSLLDILKNIPALANLLPKTSGCATGGLGGLTGGLGGLTGGLGGLGGLTGLLGGLRRGGLLGGILIPGIL